MQKYPYSLKCWTTFLNSLPQDIRQQSFHMGIFFPFLSLLPYTGGPSRAKGSIIGNINDIEFGIAFLNATVTDSPNSETRVIQAKITNVPRSLGRFYFTFYHFCSLSQAKFCAVSFHHSISLSLSEEMNLNFL